MARPKVLMACTNYWDHPLKVGSYHLARGFAKLGWQVAYISDPISPLHFLKGRCQHLRARCASYRSAGKNDGSIWHYVPGTMLPPRNLLGLRPTWVRRYWQQFTFPNLFQVVRRQGFGDVDLLYFDNARQPFWLDHLNVNKSVYRIADYTPGFPGMCASVQVDEESLARKVDHVVCVSKVTQQYAQGFGVDHISLVPNGVCFELFANDCSPCPVEYQQMGRPIAVYAGALDTWFDRQGIAQIAQRIPEVHFALIGPNNGSIQRFFKPFPNVHLLGPKPHQQLPAYLRWADVGLIPFDVEGHRELIEGVHPLKLYEYLASGLPVVASGWKGLERLQSPAQLYNSVDEFEDQLRSVVSTKHNRKELIEYAEPHDWSRRLDVLLDQVQNAPPQETKVVSAVRAA